MKIAGIRDGWAEAGIFQEGLHLLLWEADRMPPHLMLLLHGTFYSLDPSGPTVDGQGELLMRTIRRRKTRCLVVEHEIPPMRSELAVDLAHAAFSRYQGLAGDGVTCLAPIRDFYGHLMGIPLSTIEFVFQLIPELKHAGKQVAVRQLNLGTDTFELKEYDREVVAERIRIASSR